MSNFMSLFSSACYDLFVYETDEYKRCFETIYRALYMETASNVVDFLNSSDEEIEDIVHLFLNELVQDEGRYFKLKESCMNILVHIADHFLQHSKDLHIFDVDDDGNPIFNVDTEVEKNIREPLNQELHGAAFNIVQLIISLEEPRIERAQLKLER